MDHYADAQMGHEQPAPIPSPLIQRHGRHRKSDSADDHLNVPLFSVDKSREIADAWQRKQRDGQMLPCGPGRSEGTGRPTTLSAMLLPMAKRLALSKLPVLTWAPKLVKNLAGLRGDIIAGLTVGVMVIPQSMSYANIAGLQPIYGMYSAFVPVLAYSFFGTSRQLAVGPVAMVSLLVEVGLRGQLTEAECPAYFQQGNVSSPSYKPDEGDWDFQSALCPELYTDLVILTSMVCGLFQVAAGFLNLGFIVSFLAHSVISGFTSAAAITIGLSQLQDFVGFKIKKSQYVQTTLQSLFTNIGQTKHTTLLFGLGWWFLLWGARRLSVKQKARFGFLRPSAPLIVCVLGIIVAGNMSYFNGPWHACRRRLPLPPPLRAHIPPPS